MSSGTAQYRYGVLRPMATEAEFRAAGRGGRKRDDTRDAAILDAAIDMLAEVGFEAMTMEAVAARAGAGKATAYRRWPSKAEMVLEAVSRLKRGDVDLGHLPDTGTLRGDLLALFRPTSVSEAERRLRAMAGLVTLMAQHPALAEAGREAVVGSWVAANLILMRRAQARGEVGSGAAVEAVATVLPFLGAYRAMIERRPFDRTFLVDTLDQVVLPALGVEPRGEHTPADRVVSPVSVSAVACGE